MFIINTNGDVPKLKLYIVKKVVRALNLASFVAKLLKYEGNKCEVLAKVCLH